MNEAEYINEICELRARLAEVEAERDEHRTERHRLMKLVSVRESAWDAAEARLAEVEAKRDEAERKLYERTDAGREMYARLAWVTALCANPARVMEYSDFVAEVLAAVRGEGGR